MKQIIVLLSDVPPAPAAEALLASLGEVRILPATPPSAEALADCTVLIANLAVVIDRACMDGAPHLHVIASPTTGLDHIDTKVAEEKGIRIVSLKNETEFLRGISSTAELGWGLLLSLLRRLPQAIDDVKQNRWDREHFRGHSLNGKTLGIAGMGRLGSMMARYGNAFGMRVIGYDSAATGTEGCERVSFEKLLAQSDCLSIHLPLAADTTHLFDAKAFTQMKPTAVIINTSRGQIVQEKDLLAALENGTIAGYATDVLADEQAAAKTLATHPLVAYARTHDNLLITPHIGGMTVESREATDVFLAERIQEALR